MQKFDRSLNGYNIAEVNAFVDDVVVRVDAMINKMKAKDMEIINLRKELEHYKGMEATLNRAVMIAEQASTKLQSTSVKESDLIIQDAKRNANRIINDALMKAEAMEADTMRLKRNMITYKRRIRNLIDQQADIVDDLDKVDLD